MGDRYIMVVNRYYHVYGCSLKKHLCEYINSLVWLAKLFNNMNTNVTKLFEINPQNMLSYIKHVEITIFSWHMKIAFISEQTQFISR